MPVDEGLYISISCSGPSQGDCSPRIQLPLLSRLLSIVKHFVFFLRSSRGDLYFEGYADKAHEALGH